LLDASTVGVADGERDGFIVLLGSSEGSILGYSVGGELGTFDGNPETVTVGVAEGDRVGFMVILG